MKMNKIKRCLAAILLVLCIANFMCIPVVNATGIPEIAFGQVSAKCGEQVTVPVTIQNNPGIASFRFRVAYDPSALSYVSAAKGETMQSGTLSVAYQTEDEELAITWFDIKNVTGDGVIFNLVFNVSNEARGECPLIVTYLPEDIVNASWQQVEVLVTDGLVRFGSNITGTITSFGNASDEVTIKLVQGDTEIATTTTTIGNYTLSSIAPGTYSMAISKLNHATRTYEINVGGEDVVQDGKIHLIGDINGDGKVNVVDVAKANAHAKKSVFLEGYELTCADISGEGKVNVVDVAKMNAHAKKSVFLW